VNKRWAEKFNGGNIMKRALMALLSIVILFASTASFAGECGDVNGDDKLNLLDISYIINHLYRGGPEPICDGLKDIDGNIYRTVTIGTQVWMAENLKVTHYRNGDAIPTIIDNIEWRNFREGAYCHYNNDENSVATYGRLYNWYAVNDSRNIAPEGWHVPTDAEWKQLEMYLGMTQAEADAGGDTYWRGTNEGGKLKEIGTTHWNSPNTGATNESGFTALPPGWRTSMGDFLGVGTSVFMWTSTGTYGSSAYSRLLDNLHSQIIRYYDPYEWDGFSVRCVKD
jgi:uncharacterized protein (TIGR02145 family)